MPFSSSISNSVWQSESEAGLTNLWHACPKQHADRWPWNATFTAGPGLFYFFCPTRVSKLWRMCVYTYIHISDCLQTVYELPLLPNNTASETFLYKSGALRSFDWIFNIGAPSCRWLGQYLAMNERFYNLLFKQEVAAAQLLPDFLYHISRGGLYFKYNDYEK